MANHFLFFSLLISCLAAMHGTHAVQFAVIDNSGHSSAGGIRFQNEICINYSLQTLSFASFFIWKTFQIKSSTDMKYVPKVTLIIENGDGIIAYAFNGTDHELHMNANYLGNYSGDVRREFTGLIYHEMTHIYQWNGTGQAPGGLIEGIADFVRLKADYVPSHWVQPGQGDWWGQGYDVTALFLDYCEGLRNGFVAELNKKMRTGYSDDYFVELLGKTIDQLWFDYKAKYGN